MNTLTQTAKPSAAHIPMQPMRLALRDASVRWAEGTRPALDAVSLQINLGECVAVVGGNGSGKTTLLRALQGHQALSAGLRVAAAAPHGQALRVAMVFQQPFVLRLSAWANLRVALWLAGVPRAQRRDRAWGALARVGLREQAWQAAHTLSGGQRQRLALARAWAIGADVVLLDEPTASLDPAAKREVEALIGQLHADGVTVVFSTHNLGQAKRLATRVLFLEDGAVRVDRSVKAFFDEALPEAAAAFVRGDWL